MPPRARKDHVTTKGTVIFTGGSQGIGAAVVESFLEQGYAVVATSRNATKASLPSSPNLLLVDGDIAKQSTAEEVTHTAISRFGSIDHLVANAGIFIGKSFVDFTHEDFQALVSTNLEGFFHVTQLAVRRMLSQGTGGSVTSITTALVQNPIAQVHASVPMLTKGGLTAAILSLASEYAKDQIRFNAVAPGIVDTPMQTGVSKDFLRSLSPMSTISSTSDIAEAVLYLAEARHVTGQVLHVDGGAHVGKW